MCVERPWERKKVSLNGSRRGEVQRHLGGACGLCQDNRPPQACHYQRARRKPKINGDGQTQRSLGLNCKRSDALYPRYLR